jgi:hypothetical protein
MMISIQGGPAAAGGLSDRPLASPVKLEGGRWQRPGPLQYY